MPIYEYECQSCLKRFDALCSMSAADEPKTCPGCESQQSKRRVAGGHFQLVGKGWYKDGYSKQ